MLQLFVSVQFSYVALHAPLHFSLIRRTSGHHLNNVRLPLHDRDGEAVDCGWSVCSMASDP